MRDGRLYGRGAADDKSGIVAHLGRLRAFDGKPPVHVKVLIEGSEENGRQQLLEVVDRDPELMRADVMVIADNGNWKVGEPTLSLTLRGHGKLIVTLRTLSTALHCGHFGGAAPDALLALTRLIATLHDDAGDVAVEGLQDGEWDGAEWPEADFRRQAGVLDGVELVGAGQISDRLWARHAISVLGLDAPAGRRRGQHRDPAARGPRSPCASRPARTPCARWRPCERHLRAHAPWGAKLEIEVEPASTPIALGRRRARRAGARARLREAGRAHGQRRLGPARGQAARGLPGRRAVLWGAQDSDLARIHAANESVDLGEVGEDRARRGPAAGGAQPIILTVRDGALRARNAALPPNRGAEAQPAGAAGEAQVDAVGAALAELDPAGGERPLPARDGHVHRALAARGLPHRRGADDAPAGAEPAVAAGSDGERDARPEAADDDGALRARGLARRRRRRRA